MFLAGENAKWACNLFVGEALFMMGKPCLGTNKKYYSARDIWWNNYAKFTQVNKIEDIARGNIAAFDKTHVEIVTQVDQKKKTFCHRGAGRAEWSLWEWRRVGVDFGTERCKGKKLDDPKIRFFKV